MREVVSSIYTEWKAYAYLPDMLSILQKMATSESTL